MNDNMNMSVEDKKRKKNMNFNKKEEELLVELVIKNKHVLENKNKPMQICGKKKNSVGEGLLMNLTAKGCWYHAL